LPNLAIKRFEENGISYTLKKAYYGTFINWDQENAVLGSTIRAYL